MVKGQCLCGRVKFEVRGELGATRLCYCELCRRANGSAFSANVRVPASSYTLLGPRCHSRIRIIARSFPGVLLDVRVTGLCSRDV